MKYTSQQVGQKLGVSASTVLKLMRTGKLPAINAPKDGKKRTVWLFDAKVVNEFKKTFVTPPNAIGRRLNVNRRPKVEVVQSTTIQGPAGIRQMIEEMQVQITNMEEMLGRLIKMWA